MNPVRMHKIVRLMQTNHLLHWRISTIRQFYVAIDQRNGISNHIRNIEKCWYNNNSKRTYCQEGPIRRKIQHPEKPSPSSKLPTQSRAKKPQSESAVTNEASISTKPSKTKTNRKRKMRPLTDNLLNQSTSTSAGPMQQVVCIALAESFDMEALQNNELFNHQFETNPIQPDSDSIAIRCRYRTDTQHKSHHQYNDQQHQHHQEGMEKVCSNSKDESMDPKLIREFYVFSDGLVVFWDIDRYKQEHIIDHLTLVQRNPFRPSLSRSEEETMNIDYTTDKSNANDNTIFLNQNHHLDLAQLQLHLSNSPLDSGSVNPQWERFAFSHAMAASVRMGIWEQQLDELNDELGECIERLKRGEMAWHLNDGFFSTKMGKAGQMIGQIASIRHSVNSTELLDTDIYWDLTNAERVYATLAGRLKLHARQREMNQRIDYCEDFSKTVHEMLNQKHSHYLEWIIIVLIALEVVINWERLWELLKSIWDSTKGTGKSIYGFLANIGYISSTTQPAVEKAGKNEVEEEDDKVTFTDYFLSILPYIAMAGVILITFRQEFVNLYRRLACLIKGKKMPEKPKRPKQKIWTNTTTLEK